MDEPQTTTAPPANGLLDAGGRPIIPPPPDLTPRPAKQPQGPDMQPPPYVAPLPPRHEAPPRDEAAPDPGPGFEPQTAELFADEPAPKDCAIGAKAGGALLVALGAGLLYIGLDLVTGGGISRYLAGVPRGLDEE